MKRSLERRGRAIRAHVMFALLLVAPRLAYAQGAENTASTVFWLFIAVVALGCGLVVWLIYRSAVRSRTDLNPNDRGDAGP